MKPNTDFNRTKLRNDQLYLPLSGGQVNGKTIFTNEVDLGGEPKKAVKIKDGIIQSGNACYFGTCKADQASQQIKDVKLTNVDGFALRVGASIAVKFEATNTFSASASNPIMLNVNSTGGKQVYYQNTATPTGTNTTAFGRANYINTYVYDGTYWVWCGSSQDNNTTYSAMSTAELTTGTATTSRVVRADYLHNGIKQIAESGDIDTANNTATFTSSDASTATAWTSVGVLASGETHASIFAKMSQMFKNVRYLYDCVVKGNWVGTLSGSCFQSGQAYRKGNAVTVSLILKFSNLSTNTYYTISTNMPKPTMGMSISVPNEYGAAGSCTVGIDGAGKLQAKCTQANSYYYACFTYYTNDSW